MKTPPVEYLDLKKLANCAKAGIFQVIDLASPLAMRFFAMQEITRKINLKPFVPCRGRPVWLLSDKVYQVASIADLNKNKIFIRTRFIKRLREDKS